MDVDPAAADLIIGMMQAAIETFHRGRDAGITLDDESPRQKSREKVRA